MFCAVNHKKKTIVVSFRGTALRLADLAHDLGSIIPGIGVTEVTKYINEKTGFNHRFNTAIAFTNQVEQKHPGYKVILTGHSLGASLAESVAIIKKHQTELFNPGNTPINIAAAIVAKSKEYFPYIKTYRIQYDLVSACMGFGQVTEYKTTKSMFNLTHNHSIDRFIEIA
jgi:hypothetical protein